MVPPPSTLPQPFKGKRVLLIDDEASVRRSLRRLLDRLGAEVLEAVDGTAGLTTLESRQDIDGVFVDLSMPGLGGDQVLRHIRERWPTMTVLVLSGFVPDASLLDGADGIINKPFTSDGLRDTLLAAWAKKAS